jgi:hypothetical protein
MLLRVVAALTEVVAFALEALVVEPDPRELLFAVVAIELLRI